MTLLLASAGIAAAQYTTIDGVRFWSIGDTTRVAIEISGEFKFTATRLDKPDRVFFDVSSTVYEGAPTIPVGDGLVKQIRVAENRPGTVRVVLDLEESVEYTSSQLSNPERLIVELRSTVARPPTATSTAVPPAVPPIQPVSDPKPPAASRTQAQKGASPQPTGGPPAAPPQAATPPPQEATPASYAATPLTQTAAARLPEPRPATRNSNGDRSLTRVLGLKISRVLIDPGHGGHDQGTHGPGSLLEKDLALDVSQRLATLLRDRMGVEAVLTRTNDTFLSLEERTKMANEMHADLFLSVHVNSSPAKSVAGVETYYLNFSASREDLDLATRENATADSTVFDFKETVAKIALRAKIDESREFALRVQRSLHKNAVEQNKEAKDRGVKRAPFFVLIGAEMPSVLTEIGFLSNSRDAELLQTTEHRQRIAESLYDGIEAYVRSLSGSETSHAE